MVVAWPPPSTATSSATEPVVKLAGSFMSIHMPRTPRAA
jgi:hypothetical protein